MQFTQQTITILVPPGRPKEIDAMVGENSGLGYYKTTEGYIVTTTNSGYYVAWLKYYDELPVRSSPVNELIVQRFIETIAPWLDWDKSREEIEAQAEFCFGTTSTESRLRQAFYEARAQVMTVEMSN